MGTIFYGGAETQIHIEDRALAHLKVVISTKLRRGESFTLSWRHPDDEPRGRSTIWLNPSIPLRFVFDDPEPAELNPAWIRELANSASSTGGIMLVAEQIESEPVHAVDGDTTDVSLGNVAVEHLNVDRATIAGTDLAGAGLASAAS